MRGSRLSRRGWRRPDMSRFRDYRDIPEESRAQIRQVLMNDWDPIGVNDVPEAADEYDSYIADVYHLLSSEASAGKIQRYLFQVVSERMGMSPPLELEQMRPAAEALKRLQLKN